MNIAAGSMTLAERVTELSIVVCLGSVIVAALGVAYLFWRRQASLGEALRRLRREGLHPTEQRLFRALSAQVSTHEVRSLARVRGVFDRAAERWLQRRPRAQRRSRLGSLVSLRRRVPFERIGPPRPPRLEIGDRLMLRFARQGPLRACIIATGRDWIQLGLWRRRPEDVQASPGAPTSLLAFDGEEVLEAVVPLLAAGRDRCWQLRIARPQLWQPARIRVSLQDVSAGVEIELPERGDVDDATAPPRRTARVVARSREGIVLQCRGFTLEPGERVNVVGSDHEGVYSRFVRLDSLRRTSWSFLLRQTTESAVARTEEARREEVPA